MAAFWWIPLMHNNCLQFILFKVIYIENFFLYLWKGGCKPFKTNNEYLWKFTHKSYLLMALILTAWAGVLNILFNFFIKDFWKLHLILYFDLQSCENLHKRTLFVAFVTFYCRYCLSCYLFLYGITHFI